MPPRKLDICEYCGAKKPPESQPKPDLYCVICGERVQYAMADADISNICGVTGKMTGWYPSEHDCCIYQVAFCDDCVSVGLKEGRIRCVGRTTPWGGEIAEPS